MEGDFININKKLVPLSWVYGLGVGIRNLLFEMGVLKSRTYETPVISVGNITVGGTGKTPHVEYLIRLLKDRLNVAVLSRGYKRKSRGFLVASEESTMRDIGDEPFQMKQKFPEVTVAVDKKRTRGIDNLTSGLHTEKPVDVILLDDAFQHRYVKPGINILLVDYHRLIIYDELLPAGRLREPVKSKNRADIVIVTKCPQDLKPMEFRVITKAMNLYPYQQLYFSTHEYEALKPVFPEEAEPSPGAIRALNGQNILLLTGIASPEQMQLDLAPYAGRIEPLTFGDHHHFKKKDFARINEAFAALPSPKLIITTEKDATRLIGTSLMSDEARRHLYTLPVHVKLLLGQGKTFNNNIIEYVRKNTRDGVMAESKNDVEPEDSHRTGDRPRTISFRNN